MSRSVIHHATVAGGMKVAIEPSASAQVASIVWLLPVGSAGDPLGEAGAGEASVLHDVILRGAGDLRSRPFSDALDRLGVQRATSTSAYHISITAVCLGDALEETLGLLAMMVTAPRIEEDSFEASRDLALQSLRSLRDDPHHFVTIKAAERALPAPFNTSGHGSEEGLAALSASRLRQTWTRRSRPTGSLLALAGCVDPVRVITKLERALEHWRGASEEPQVTASSVRGVVAESMPSSQTNMMLIHDAPRDADPASLPHRLGVRLLGGEGMSNRLFTEVREKRGLCYSVGMAYSAGRDRGIMQAYAASTPDRAQLTLSCMRAEIAKMAHGVTGEEFARGLVGFKSALVMNGESTHARAGALAGDLFRLGRGRGLDEKVAEVDRLTLRALNDHLALAFGESALKNETLAVVGPASVVLA